MIGVDAALEPGATLLYPEWGTNEFLAMEGETPGLDAALAAAPRRLQVSLESHRLCGLPLEGHGAQATWDAGTGRLTVVASSQQPHQLRSVIAEICGLDETHVRVISPDMGGGFGNKQHFTREECLVGLLARLTGRPVRWSQDRTESLTASIHARAQVHEVDAGYDTDGRILAMRVRIRSDVGNPVLYFSGVGPAVVSVASLPGAYAIEQLGWQLSCVATNTCSVGAYRGFGQPEAHLTTERVMDLVAADLGLDPVQVRRINLLPDAPRPWRGHGGQRVDVGLLGRQLDTLVEAFGYAEWRRRQGEARAGGRYVGIGVSMLVQGTTPTQNDTAGRFASLEMAAVTVLPDGRVEVRVGTKSQGQGHETTFAQVAATALGVDAALVTVRDGDTDALPYGQGTWGSRSAVMGGGAILQAAGDIRVKMGEVAKGLGLDFPAVGPVDPEVFGRVAAVSWWHPHLLPPDCDPGLTRARSTRRASRVHRLMAGPTTMSLRVARHRRRRRGRPGHRAGHGAGRGAGLRLRGRGQPRGRRGSASGRVRPGSRGRPVRGGALPGGRSTAVHHPPRLYDSYIARGAGPPGGTPPNAVGGRRGLPRHGRSVDHRHARRPGGRGGGRPPALGSAAAFDPLHAAALRSAIRATGWRPDPAAWAAAESD